MTGKIALIADIGGTNARFGIVDASGVHNLQYLVCAEYQSFADAVRSYLDRPDSKAFAKPDIAIFAVAGPVSDDVIQITALPWEFSKTRIRDELGFAQVEFINDFEAVALAIPPVSSDLLHRLHGSEPRAHFAKGVIGPGTGLGVASLVWSGDRYIAQAGEGGHVTMPAKTQREFDIFQQLKNKYHHISAERVCSGKGMENLYNAIRALDGKNSLPDLKAPEISEKAMQDSCGVAKESLDLMLAFLGRVTGNLALTLNAQGGIYIAGGIPTKLGEYFLQSRFMEEFKSKGRMSELMDKMPVYLVRHDAIGLLGLEARAKTALIVTQR